MDNFIPIPIMDNFIHIPIMDNFIHIPIMDNFIPIPIMNNPPFRLLSNKGQSEIIQKFIFLTF